MKRILIILSFLLLTVSLYAEKITLQTGKAFGTSNTYYFCPKDITFTDSRLNVTSVKKIEDNLWCFTLTASKSANTNAPVSFEFYVKKDDVLTMRHFQIH